MIDAYLLVVKRKMMEYLVKEREKQQNNSFHKIRKNKFIIYQSQQIQPISLQQNIYDEFTYDLIKCLILNFRIGKKVKYKCIIYFFHLIKKDISLQSIQNYIIDISKEPSIEISFLVSDKKVHNAILALDTYQWANQYEFYDILHQADIVFSEKKNTIKELLDYFSFQKEQSTIQKSETYQTASLISRVVLILLRTTIPFKDPLNFSTLKSQSDPNKLKSTSREESSSMLQSPSSKLPKQINKDISSSSSDTTKQLQNFSAQKQSQLDKEEVWGDQSDNKDTKLSELIQGSGAFTTTSGGSQNNGLSSLITIVKNDKEGLADNKKNTRSDNDSSRSRSRSFKASSGDSKGSSNSRSSSSRSSSRSDSNDSQSDRRYSNSCRKDSYQYLRLRGLPFNARENELQDFLGITLNPEQLTFKHDNDGRFSGECVIRTRDLAQYDRIKEMHMKNMGKRYIEVFNAERSDFSRAQESQSIDDQKGSFSSSSNPIYDAEFLQNISIVKIRGLPYNATDNDIQVFFKDSQIIQNGIQKVYDGRRPSGEAFVLFATKQDAQKAIDKDKQRMGQRYIEIFLSHPKEYTNHIKKRKSYSGSNGGSGSSGPFNRFSNNHGNRYDRYSGNNGGYQSSHYNNYRGNDRYHNNHSRYSNSPHRNNGNYQSDYKKGQMGGPNGNFDRNQKNNNFQDHPPRYNNYNRGDNKFGYNKQGYYQNNNQNQNNGNNNHNNGGYGNRNNYQSDYNNRNRYKGKDDYAKIGGGDYRYNEDNRYKQSQQYPQQQQQSSSASQPNQSQSTQQTNWQQGNKSQQQGGYQNEQGTQQYNRQEYYPNQAQQNSSQQPQQQHQQTGYPHENASSSTTNASNTTDTQPHQSQQQQQQHQYYYIGNNPHQGQFSQYQNPHFAQQGNQYDHHQQHYQYGQQQNIHANQSFPHHNYYGQSQSEQQYGQQGANANQANQAAVATTVAPSIPAATQFYQSHQYDNQQQQYRYY